MKPATILVCAADEAARASWLQCLADELPASTVLSAGNDPDLLALCPGASADIVIVDRAAFPAADDATLMRIRETCCPASMVLSVPWFPIDGLDIVRALGITACVPHHYTGTQRRLALELSLTGAGHYPTEFTPRPIPADARRITDGETPGPYDPASGEAPLLTRRQQDVAEWLVRGKTNLEIANILGLKEGPTKNHVSEIFRRLGVENRTQAVDKLRRLEEIRTRLESLQHEKRRVLDWLVRHVTHIHYGSGSVIFRKGDPGKDLYYVLRGTVGLDEIDETMGPGEIFGDIGAFAPSHRRTCTARARADVDLFRLDSGRVRRIFFDYPEFALHVVSVIAQRVAAGRGL